MRDRWGYKTCKHVGIPAGSPIFVLEFNRTNDTRHEVIVAKTFAGIQKTWDRLVEEEEGHVIAGHLYAGTVVEISVKMRELVAEAERQSKIDDMVRRVKSKMRDLAKAGKPLPPMFVLCNLVQNPGYAAEDPWFERSCHDSDCDCGGGGVKMTGLTREELYERYKEKMPAGY